MLLLTDHIEQSVENCLERHGLVGRGCVLVVATSGGSDSTALLHCLSNLSHRLDIRLHVAHMDHGVRGHESYGDSMHVKALACRMQLPVSLKKVDLQHGKEKSGVSSFESIARHARYSFLSRVAREQKATAVALGHTYDDQSETILMNLLRGSGLHGLAGMDEYAHLQITDSDISLNLLRPLLNIQKADIIRYCGEQRIEYRTDRSNESLEFTRNKIRHDLLPVLRGYNPRVDHALERISRIARESVTYLESEVSRLWPSIVKGNDRFLVVNSIILAKQAAVIQKIILRRVYATVAGDVCGLEENHLRTIERMVGGQAGKVITLPRGIVMYLGYGELIFGRDPSEICPFPKVVGCYQLRIPGLTKGTGLDISVTESEDFNRNYSNYSVYLDGDKIGKELWVRSWDHGDRFQPIGMQKHKKLQDFFVDTKIPRLWRERIPLLVTERGIAWVVGYRVAHWAAADENSKSVLSLKAVINSID